MIGLDAEIERGLRMLRAKFPQSAVRYRPAYVGEYDTNDDGKRFIPPECVMECPTCGKTHALPAKHLAYVGHAHVTERLNKVDPGWYWEPMASDQNGNPILSHGGMWIRLYVLGQMRIGFGASDNSGPDAIKEIIGDAIRNAAMRFGCGLELWMPSDGDDEVTELPAARQPHEGPGAHPDAPDDREVILL